MWLSIPLALSLLAPQASSPEPQLVADLNSSAPEQIVLLAARAGALGRFWIRGLTFEDGTVKTWNLDLEQRQLLPFGLFHAYGHRYVEVLQAVELDANRALFFTQGTTINALDTETVVWSYDQRTETLTPLLDENQVESVEGMASAGGFGYLLSEGRCFVTDGTPAGTQLVEQWISGYSYLPDARDRRLVSFNGGVVFVLRGAVETQLRRLQGAAAPSTVLLTVPTPEWDLGARWIAGSQSAFFARTTAAEGSEPWAWDSSSGVALPLGDLGPGPEGSEPVWLDALGSVAYFAASTAAAGREVWSTGGTPSGTRLVVDLTPGGASTGNLEFDQAVATPSGLLAMAGTAEFGVEPWLLDPVARTADLIQDLTPGGAATDFRQLAAAGDLVGCLATTPAAGREPLVIDASSGELVLFDTLPGATSGLAFTGLLAGPVFADGHVAFFSVGDGPRVWVSDGTAQGSAGLPGADLLGESSDANPGFKLSSKPTAYLSNGRFEIQEPQTSQPGPRALFSANVDGTGPLLVTDGTPAGTEVLAEGPSGNAVAFGHRFLIPLFTAEAGFEPWVSDGTSQGTYPLADILPGPGSSIESGLLEARQVGGRVVFAADVPAKGRELVYTDGSPAGTGLLADLLRGMEGSDPQLLDVVGGRLLFLAASRETPLGNGVWSTDGTPSGTELITALPARAFDPTLNADGFVYFQVPLETGGPFPENELWRSDGTLAGTQPASRFAPGLGLLFDRTRIITLGDRLVIDENGIVHGLQTDGSVELLIDSNVVWVLKGLKYVFATRWDAGDYQIWRTDGSAAGTELIPIDGVGYIRGVSIDNEGTLWTTQELPGRGREPALIDGATGQAVVLPEIRPGPLDGAPTFAQAFRVGNRLLVAVDDGVVGNELFAYDLSDLGGNAAVPYGDGCGSVGAPYLSLVGNPGLGQDVELVLDECAQNVPALFAVGDYGGALAGNCYVQVADAELFTISATDADGHASLWIPITSDPALLGAQVFLQAVTLVPGGPVLGAFELSNGLEIVLGS